MKLLFLLFIGFIAIQSTLGFRRIYHKVIIRKLIIIRPLPIGKPSGAQIVCHDKGDNIFSQTCQSLQELRIDTQDERLRSRLIGVIQEEANRILQLVHEMPHKSFDKIKDCIESFKNAVIVYRKDSEQEFIEGSKEDNDDIAAIEKDFKMNIERATHGALHCMA